MGTLDAYLLLFDAIQGYLPFAPDSVGRLAAYKEEFSVWASFSPLTGRALHQYTFDATRGQWCLKHQECLKVAEPGDRPCCAKCLSLGGPKSVVKRVVRFTAKYNAALLLNYRLFQSPQETMDLLERVSGATFGTFNKKFWKKVTSFSNSTLQVWVRRSWMCIAPEDRSQGTLRMFVSTVVVPCLKVNVASIDCSMARLSACFVTALASQDLSDLWLSKQ